MQAGGRARRQPAWHMLASEFSEATLNEKGSGEYDPSFVITKLGAKVNRVIVAGLLERLEVRETSNGSTLYQGQMRDPSGVHYFSVGDYASESMRELTLKLVEKTEVGEPVLLLMTAKSRWYQTDEGAVYTSLRPEEACEIDAKTYALWLTRASEGTLQRMKIHSDSLSAEPTKEGLSAAGVPDHMVEGLLLSRNHYGDIDTENYTLNVMQALDIAEGRMEAASQPAPAPQAKLDDEGAPVDSAEDDVKDTLVAIIGQLDQGDGVDFETVLTNAGARGIDRQVAESKLDELSNEGTLHEPRFGWFRIVS
jgi:RPA family protein|tara:strand:- start:37870 stop:38796 length:927 start_codon:yes stop_codon:yes gene_type:complete